MSAVLVVVLVSVISAVIGAVGSGRCLEEIEQYRGALSSA